MYRGRAALLAAVLCALALLSGSGTASGSSHPRVKALFFGDSLIAGTGATPRRPVEVRTASELLSWEPVVDGFGGTGYTTGGRHGRPYLDRLRHDGYLHTPYDVIVLEGGTNDAHHGSLTKLRKAMLDTIDYVHARQPWARLVIVSGYVPAGVDPVRYAQVDVIASEVAAARHLVYVSQYHYSTNATDFLSPDAYHPSDVGYRLMGRDLAASLDLLRG
jgi:lysophospholipase L1-like esterase